MLSCSLTIRLVKNNTFYVQVSGNDRLVYILHPHPIVHYNCTLAFHSSKDYFLASATERPFVVTSLEVCD